MSGDFFKDTPVRYFGYANELGEAFRPFIPVVLVRSTYGVASLYAAADACHKGYMAKYKYADATSGTRNSYVTRAIVDTLIWQGLASVVIPGFTINRIVWITRYMLAQKFPKSSRRAATVMGLMSIPVIIQPIDRTVDWMMNLTLRKYSLFNPKSSDYIHNDSVAHDPDG